MRIRAYWIPLFLLVANFVFCSESLAASLNGRVLTVNDGDEITIFNLNRPVRVKLVGIDAPEKDQAFGAAAKQHLFDLVSDKNVTVEYSGIGQHSSLIGRVLLNDIDICAQMIRDGAAWFDPASSVSGTQREIYFQSEQAARNEKRGLWQTGDAVAPWEFVKAEHLKRNPVAALPTVSPTQPVRRDGPTPELNSLSLLKTGTALPRANREGIYIENNSTAWLTDGPYRKTWRRLQPSGTSFSALVPNGGDQGTTKIPFGGQTYDVTYYRAKDAESLIELVWLTGPSLRESDEEVLASGLNSIIRGVGSGFEARGGGSFSCDPTSRKISAPLGFSGREYDLTSCTAPGMARVFTRQNGMERDLYIGFVFYKEEDENIMKFLKSFTIASEAKSAVKPSANAKPAK